MREMNPMRSQSDDQLSKALRQLAANSSQAALPEVGIELAAAFRRHHARRRLVRMVRIATLAACLVLAALLWMRRPSHPPLNVANVSATSAKVPGNASEATVVTSVAPKQTPSVAKRVSAKRPIRPAADRQFVALPAYDPRIPLDELRVLRVQIPASALWQMGAPLNSDTANRRMLADFVVGQDGTPYAVRLLQ